LAEIKTPLSYLEWQALSLLYRYRDRSSSPVRYVGLPATISALAHRHPPLAQWVGKASENQIHITDEGIAYYETDHQAEFGS
jgi:hypothetical protein